MGRCLTFTLGLFIYMNFSSLRNSAYSRIFCCLLAFFITVSASGKKTDFQTDFFQDIESLLADSSPLEAIDLLENVLEDDSFTNEEQALGKTYYFLGLAYQEAGNSIKAERKLKKALQYFKTTNATKELAQTHEALGHLAQSGNNLNQALENYQESLAYHKQAGDSLRMTKILNLLGNTYWKQKKLDLALVYHLDCLYLRTKLRDQEGTAFSLNNIALIYKDMERYNQALEYLVRAIKAGEKAGNRKAIAYTLNLLGSVHWNLENYNEALDYYQQALKIREEIGDTEDIASSLISIGNTCKQINLHNVSLEYYIKALNIYTELGQEKRSAFALNEIATAYTHLEKYDQAISYYKRALEIRKKHNETIAIANTYRNIGIAYKERGDFDSALKFYAQAYDVYEESGHVNGQQTITIYKANIYYDQQAYQQALKHYQQALSMTSNMRDQRNMAHLLDRLSDIHARLHHYKQAYTYQLQYNQIKDSISGYEMGIEVEKQLAQYEIEKKEKEIELINRINKLEISKQQSLIERKNLMINIYFAVFLLFGVFVVIMYLQKRKISVAHQQIYAEKEKTDKLLLNVFPQRIAEELKSYGYSKPELFQHVTVFFSDLINFTEISSSLSPNALIDELNILFTAFDEIMEKHQCERIKTIGDAYMSVCGMHDPDPDNAEKMIRAAIDIIAYIKSKNEVSEIQWNIRIGIHTGDVVGGIVGIRKYLYDAFGDAVNMASRMETNCENLRINISESTYLLVQDLFVFEERPAMPVKGIGKVKMYYVIV